MITEPSFSGSTGSLGAHILAKLLETRSVVKIYALNRRSSSGNNLHKRQSEAFLDRGLAASLLDSSKLILMECDYGCKKLGLSDELYEEVG